ncbi:hypothetical protein [Aquibacillus kalidii]|uniref:hypothetical protein n=1 Tax=Aquibacillus kalidii TaxID=2762597 RepID=UPI001649171B|nr:hypothetical protein [Aquibacillus kalidii]
MRCNCDNKETFQLKLEGDVDTDPIWCGECGVNITLQELPISRELKAELVEWVMIYDEWIDWSKDRLRPNGIELEEKHNKLGQQLTEKLKQELGAKYKVAFAPSLSARMYVGLDF